MTYNNSANYQVSQYDVVTGGANNLLNNVPSAASGTVLTSNGVSAQPSFQSVSSGAFPWSVVSATSQTCVVNNGYISSNASQVNMYLPSTAAVGNEQKFVNIGTGFIVQPAYGQTLSFLSQTATYPSNLQTNASQAAMDIVCVNASTSWNVINNEGTFTQGIITSALSGCFSSVDFMYIKANGTAWGCGQNSYGELGNQNETSYSSPIATVGGNSYIQVVTANNTTMALRGDGTAWAWGNNGIGQIGNLTTTSYSSPVSVIGGFSFIQIDTAGNNTVSLSAGLTNTGTMFTWGNGGDGQIGNQTTNSYSSPVSVVGNHSFVQISLGTNFAYGLKATGDIWGWGLNTFGNIGNNTTNSYSSPVSVVGNHSFIQISAGKSSILALKVDGSCWFWGNNSFGCAGNQTNNTSYSSPISVVGAHSFIQIASGGHSSCYGLKATGDVWAWGDNASGQLAQNNTTSYSSPVSVIGNFSFVKIARNGQDVTISSMGGWLSNGQLYAWGANTYGELGNNTITNFSSPILILNTP